MRLLRPGDLRAARRRHALHRDSPRPPADDRPGDPLAPGALPLPRAARWTSRSTALSGGESARGSRWRGWCSRGPRGSPWTSRRTTWTCAGRTALEEIAGRVRRLAGVHQPRPRLPRRAVHEHPRGEGRPPCAPSAATIQRVPRNRRSPRPRSERPDRAQKTGGEEAPAPTEEQEGGARRNEAKKGQAAEEEDQGQTEATRISFKKLEEAIIELEGEREEADREALATEEVYRDPEALQATAQFRLAEVERDLEEKNSEWEAWAS